MKNRSLLLAAAVASLASASFLVASATPAHANGVCAPFPDVAWWDTSHEKTIRFVTSRHNGDWRAYLQSWENQRRQLQKMSDDGKSAYIKSKKLTLKGRGLSQYIEKVVARIDVIKCLKNQAQGLVTTKIDDRDIKLSVGVRCDNRTPVFEITNLGSKWPRLGSITILRMSDEKVLMKRGMRLAAGQLATFRMAERKKERHGELGLFIQPSWFERPFVLDARIQCRTG